MAKAKVQSEAPVAKGKASPLSAFVHHQQTALEETGKALASLLPKDFRTHAANALEEGRAGFCVLFDGVIESVQSGLDALRSKPKDGEPDDPAKKVKVEVE